MSDLDHWLERGYSAGSTAENRRIYDDWADSYDADVSSGGYAYAPMAAGLFGRYVAPGETPVLDAGCGSGIIGATLARLGYANLTGIDLSDGMLRAAERKGVYRDLRQRVLGEPESGSHSDRIARAFRLATARPPTAEEGRILLNSLEGHLASYRSNRKAARELVDTGESPVPKGLDPREVAAYTAVASLILNLDETITKE